MWFVKHVFSVQTFVGGNDVMYCAEPHGTDCS
jgi:hypothetical protein